MQTVSVILFLVLASTNASKYIHPRPLPYQEEPRERQSSDEPFYPQDGYIDDNFGLFLPKLALDSDSGEEWTSATDPRTAILQQVLADRLTKADELRSKRTEASLSIVNALDVLRQRLILELARRKMNESKAQIEKNRVLLIKTGKRSQRNYEEALREFLLRRRMQRDELMGKPLPGTSTKESEEGSTTRKNTESDPGFQT